MFRWSILKISEAGKSKRIIVNIVVWCGHNEWSQRQMHQEADDRNSKFWSPSPELVFSRNYTNPQNLGKWINTAKSMSLLLSCHLLWEWHCKRCVLLARVWAFMFERWCSSWWMGNSNRLESRRFYIKLAAINILSISSKLITHATNYITCIRAKSYLILHATNYIAFNPIWCELKASLIITINLMINESTRNC